jgi:hypothetical protein
MRAGDQSSRHKQLQCPPQPAATQNSDIGGEISRNPRNRSEASRRGRRREVGAHRAGAASEKDVVEDVAVRHLRHRRLWLPHARPSSPLLLGGANTRRDPRSLSIGSADGNRRSIGARGRGGVVALALLYRKEPLPPTDQRAQFARETRIRSLGAIAFTACGVYLS